ncbi:hypothetical protein Tsubulata_043932 [Turnera subulata]|uniref:CCHC-type domain-containing protein n=1 Tax=Turnera subulata TaxID=218843 RepID=A0A9Q0FY11_9ROSI|nr:hypothetical protein Tsubulata_043932 [Turnera subulata]
MEQEQPRGDVRMVPLLELGTRMKTRGGIEEEEVFILEETEIAKEEVNLFCVLGKILGTKHVNPQAFANVMKKVWNLLKGIEVEQINQNLFLFKFFNKCDRQMILDIPLNQRTMRNVSGIASRGGKFVGFDEKGAIGWGKFLRACILLNIDKPLRKSLTISKEGGPTMEVSFCYEGIPNFCYICGKLGHVLKKCDCYNEDSVEEEKHNFGELLRASSRKPYSVKIEAVRDLPLLNQEGAPSKGCEGLVGTITEDARASHESNLAAMVSAGVTDPVNNKNERPSGAETMEKQPLSLSFPLGCTDGGVGESTPENKRGRPACKQVCKTGSNSSKLTLMQEQGIPVQPSMDNLENGFVCEQLGTNSFSYSNQNRDGGGYRGVKSRLR